MKVSGHLLRAGWLSAVAVLTVTALAVASAPASADEIGVLSVREVSGTSAFPTTVSYDAPSGTPLLDHFFFRDVSDDQHLFELSALPSGFGAVAVSFEDNDGGELWEYRVAVQQVPSSGLVTGTLDDVCAGSCTRQITRPAGDYVFVLTGFSFTFGVWDGDHHIDEIGIIENQGRLTHYFNDQNDDDEYHVIIRYVWVPRSRLSTVSTASGTVRSAGSVTRTVHSGDKVIRGFHVDNLASGGSGDNHIKRFGFLTRSTTVDIYYGDSNPADSADWSYQFRYSVLN